MAAGASHAGGTQSSNPLCSSEESSANQVPGCSKTLTVQVVDVPGWDGEFESPLLLRRVYCEPARPPPSTWISVERIKASPVPVGQI